ncbi:DUF4303 domain-containing protein [Cronobacter malonaticus]|uniref:DUF4303 domain-containing protein n=1 Tax=Cronobacter malonaticus TaxID=413503 RepID=UPI001E3506E9|nr:DUF4303 domain-containing protein [Cronobacter malonaticus]MDI7594797.1 DUF4303 domain-containing protein [Cronobacter malonaticus]MDK1255714.1 DUF4303 domain-containing protein [Cronobacter malonaticus]MDK1318905.1 DUF4303 domain-containing protein [Cronobacter malonaticus]MDT3598031.1 DUF4303 domain-containing protein [Cronobacter malonaticus]
MAQQAFDWQALEEAAVTMMVAAVRDVHQQHPQERLYGATFHAFYGDGAVLYWPCIAVGTEESLARRVAEYQAQGDTSSPASLTESLRWSSADLPYKLKGWHRSAEISLRATLPFPCGRKLTTIFCAASRRPPKRRVSSSSVKAWWIRILLLSPKTTPVSLSL